MKKINFKVRYKAFFLVSILFSATVFSCNESSKDLVKPKTIMDVLLANDQLSIFREIVVGSKMEDALRTENLTLFAPDNAAFLKSNVTAAKILAMKDSAVWFVNYHVISPPKRYTDFTSTKLLAISKDTLKIERSSIDSTISVNRAKIVTKDVSAANGYIQVVDRVLTEK